jgi:phosphatidylinositol 3-kinase
VRKFAVKSIDAVSAADLQPYIPQLLQALKVKFSEALRDILLRHCKDDKVFATSLYWAGVTESDDPSIGPVLAELKEKVSPALTTELEHQKKLIGRIRGLMEATSKGSPAQIRDRIREVLEGEFKDLLSFPAFRLPLAPEILVTGIDPSDVKVFASKLKPVGLSLVRAEGGRIIVIFKIGDDMRQDALILQLFTVMGNVFTRAGLALPITVYRTLAFAKDYGACEFVQNARAIRDILDDRKTIRTFLAEDDTRPMEAKVETFTASLAAYCVMTYVLKIGDRHDNNILVTRDGRLLHIDFGFILGDVTKPFTPPLKLSQEMMDTIGADGMQKICGWAGPAFNSLRKRARLIIALIELMFSAPFACFQQNAARRLQQVENTLLLSVTEIEAINSLHATFSESLNSKMQVLWDKVHVVALTANAPSADGESEREKKKALRAAAKEAGG